jgi:hypothetical protein
MCEQRSGEVCQMWDRLRVSSALISAQTRSDRSRGRCLLICTRCRSPSCTCWSVRSWPGRNQEPSATGKAARRQIPRLAKRTDSGTRVYDRPGPRRGNQSRRVTRFECVHFPGVGKAYAPGQLIFGSSCLISAHTTLCGQRPASDPYRAMGQGAGWMQWARHGRASECHPGAGG